MSGSAVSARLDGLKFSNSLPKTAHVHASSGLRHLPAQVALHHSSSHDMHHRRALKRQKTDTTQRPGLCLCTRAGANTEQAPFRRRGRRYRDNLLDNLEADQPSDWSTILRSPQQDPRRQPNRRTTDSGSDTAVIQSSSSPAAAAEEGVGWGEGGGPDDWGWGLDNPTLAAATGDYKRELQNGANGQNSRNSWSSEPAARPGYKDNWGGSEPEDAEDWADDEAAPADDAAAADSTPDVTVLDSSEVDQLLKLAPQQPQVQYYSGTPVDLGVRLGTGLVLTIVASKIPFVAAGALTYPLWWPIYKAWWQNQKLRSQYRYVGLWQTSVLQLDLAAPARARQEASRPIINFLFGDVGSARTQVDVPYNQQYQEVNVGEPAELLLLSNTPDFSSFKALKEVYLPESGVWIAKYPFVDRDVFLDISLDIERERKSQE